MRISVVIVAAVAALVLPATAHAGSPPQLATGVQSLSVLAGWPAGFTATATDPDGGAVTFDWLFDDGATATGGQVSHVWEAPGTHTALVTATDAAGDTSAAQLSVEVLPNPSGSRPLPVGPPPAVGLPIAVDPPEASLVDRRLKLSRSRAIRIRIACAPHADCDGTVALARGGKTLGSVAYAVRAGTTATVRVRVPRASAKRLRRRGASKVRVTLTPSTGTPAGATLPLRVR